MRIPAGAPKKTVPLGGLSFFFKGIRIKIESPGGAFISQCKHWLILLFHFAVPRKVKRNASESPLEHQIRKNDEGFLQIVFFAAL